MLVQHFEPHGRLFTNFHYYYYILNTDQELFLLSFSLLWSHHLCFIHIHTHASIFDYLLSILLLYFPADTSLPHISFKFSLVLSGHTFSLVLFNHMICLCFLWFFLVTRGVYTLTSSFQSRNMFHKGCKNTHKLLTYLLLLVRRCAYAFAGSFFSHNMFLLLLVHSHDTHLSKTSDDGPKGLVLFVQQMHASSSAMAQSVQLVDQYRII